MIRTAPLALRWLRSTTLGKARQAMDWGDRCGTRRQALIPRSVVTTAADPRVRGSDDLWLPLDQDSVREHWRRLTGGGGTSLVVRSSSAVEDAEVSSTAGQFRSVLDVRGWEAFLDAVREVYASAARLAGQGSVHPMALLVQPFIRPDCGGVLFGVDPVTGDSDQIVVEAGAGGPESLVSGRTAAQHCVISRRGRLHLIDHHRPREQARTSSSAPLLNRHRLRALAALSRRAEATFGGP